jgi:hypothetical protein
VTVNLTDDEIMALDALARANGTTPTQELREAIATHRLVCEARGKRADILIRYRNGSQYRILFGPDLQP